ncbi:PREDICTED: uncharacterized protein LOC104991755 [Bison bison bison]|uniref:Uncharacterized protein LOC104991755 n=1 Tax=Bison bison bison TaxID=43346 RepID=A0A6P3HVT7_BISBB|nr:PREDICTED: uncharacterized protein LOC104991755 [Bison bison bison]
MAIYVSLINKCDDWASYRIFKLQLQEGMGKTIPVPVVNIFSPLSWASLQQKSPGDHSLQIEDFVQCTALIGLEFCPVQFASSVPTYHSVEASLHRRECVKSFSGLPVPRSWRCEGLKIPSFKLLHGTKGRRIQWENKEVCWTMSSINGLLKAILQHRYQRLQIVSALLIFGELNTEGNELENIKKGMNLNYLELFLDLPPQLLMNQAVHSVVQETMPQ